MGDALEQLSEEQIRDLQEGFNKFQEEGTNTLLTSSIGGLVRYLGQNPTEDELEQMKNDADKDKVGSVDFSKFVAMLVKACKSGDTEEELLEGFKVFDLDGNGFISQEEFLKVTQNLGESSTVDEVVEMVKDADLDGDGSINYEEFVQMLQADLKK